ncbi:MAG: sugar transferase [Phototrophicaceae bacterium]
MTRFRTLIILSVVWLTLVFNLERPDIELLGLGIDEININLDSYVYIAAFVGALIAILMPDVSRRTEYIFVPMVGIYALLKTFFGIPLGQTNLAIFTLEVVIIYLTIVIFRLLSQALLSFENTVENVLIPPDEFRIMPMSRGLETLQAELARARRFERNVGVVYVSTEELLRSRLGTYKFDLEQELQKHYLQVRLAQVIELVVYKIDGVMLYQNDIVIIMPETTAERLERATARLYKEISQRLAIKVMVGSAMFPEDGFIYNDLIEKAQSRLRHLDDENSSHSDTNNGGGKLGEVTSSPMLSASSGGALPLSQLTPIKASLTTIERKQVNSGVSAGLQQIFQPWPDVQPPNASDFWLGADSQYDQLLRPDSWLNILPYQTETSRSLYSFLKRIFDTFVVLMVMPFILPIGLVVALLIYLEDRGPIFFMQYRTGRGGERFKMVKFRTMVPNAEEKLKELAAQGLAKLNADGKLAEPLKLKRDPRITRIGSILRKTSLDELPQLLNVLRGDMSIVGPRPTSWGLDSYQLFHTERLGVRPGITGLWQVAARGTTDFNIWVDFDRMYVNKMCVSLDIQILVRTFLAVFQQRGAR